jgi:hypothetical protein
VQPSLFDTHNLAEITHPDYPGERLICCRNPALADERARKRQALLAATEKDLANIAASVQTGRLTGADKISSSLAGVSPLPVMVVSGGASSAVIGSPKIFSSSRAVAGRSSPRGRPLTSRCRWRRLRGA